jgi:hypothetical protein
MGPPASACNEVLRQEAKAIGVDLRRFPDCANSQKTKIQNEGEPVTVI